MPDVLNWNQSRLGGGGGVNVRKDNIYRKSDTAEQRARLKMQCLSANLQ